MSAQETPTSTEVLVIGGGPAGAAAGYWLAKAGHDVCIVERKTFPREKTCGDGLTPRAVRQLNDMGLADELTKYHRYQGLRSTGMGRVLELNWPSHPDYPPYGYVVRRRDLDISAGRNDAVFHEGGARAENAIQGDRPSTADRQTRSAGARRYADRRE